MGADVGATSAISPLKYTNLGEAAQRVLIGCFVRENARLVSRQWKLVRDQTTTGLRFSQGATDERIISILVSANCPNITTIHLNYTEVTDAGIQSLAKHCPNITTIELTGTSTEVTDAGIQSLAQHCPNITTINLYNTAVTNAGIRSLAEHCPNITTINLNSTAVTDAGIQPLAEHCPN